MDLKLFFKHNSFRKVRFRVSAEGQKIRADAEEYSEFLMLSHLCIRKGLEFGSLAV